MGTTYTYDSAGEHLIGIVDPLGTTRFSYVAGQGAASEHALSSITFADGTHFFFTYDSRGRLIQQYRDGQAEAVAFSYAADGTITATDVSQVQRRVSPTDLGYAGIVIGALGETTRMFYDAGGNLLQSAGAEGVNVTAQYNSLNDLTRFTDPNGGVYAMQYSEALDRLTSLTDSQGNVTQFQYDANGNLSGQGYPDGSQETFVSDAAGNLTIATNRRSEATSYTYDSQGRRTKMQYADGSSVTVTYDSRWNVVTLTDASGPTDFQYDSADRVTRITYPTGRYLQYTYDADGRRTRIVDSSGFVENYSYDNVGRLARLSDGNGSTIVAYGYDSRSQLVRKDLGNGTYTTYAYDAGGNLSHQVNYTASDSVVSRFDYTYDTAGRVMSLTTRDGQWTYQHDAAGQLTHAVFASSNPAIPSQDLAYVYDAMGNRTQTLENGQPTQYRTNNLNQYIQTGSISHVYDADGNLIRTSDGTGTWNYTYDVLDRLVGVSHGSDAWSYGYDVLGNRTRTTHNGVTTTYLVDPLSGDGDVVAEFDGSGSVTAHYTQGWDLTSRVASDGTAAYYAYDGAGNTSELTGAGGGLLNQYAYRPFGQSLKKSEQVANPFQFVGAAGVMAEASGLYFMRARFYDPATGRFAQQDPLGLGGGDANLYRYAGNNPTNITDPAGLAGRSVLDSIAATDRYLGEIKSQAARDKVLRENREIEALVGQNASDATTIALIRLALERTKDVKDPSGHYDAALGLVMNQWRSRWVKDPNLAATDHYLQNRAEMTRSTTSAISSLVGGWAGVLAYQGLKVVSYGLPALPNRLSVKNESLNRGSDPSFHQWLWGNLGVYAPPDLVKTIENSSSNDPNDIVGPAGYGDPHWIIPDTTLPYTIHFENKSTATASAQEVVVTHTLPADLDWSTFQIVSLGFNNQTINVPAGRQSYSVVTSVPTDPNPVRVSVSLNPVTGLVTWDVKSEDPLTHDLPEDPFAGFLPPNGASHQGEGYVTFTIRPKAGLATGTVLANRAAIVFDVNPVIPTNEVLNTIDAGPPTSNVVVLPALVGPTFSVTWQGTDDSGGSGIATYDVYVSDTDGPWTKWQDHTALTSASFTGQVDHIYRFFSQATDHVGHQESPPITYDARTTVTAQSNWQNPVNPYDVSGDGGPATPLDALTLIAYINSHSGDMSLPASPALPPPYYNVNGDDAITATDVLLVITDINRRGTAAAEAEPSPLLSLALAPQQEPGFGSSTFDSSPVWLPNSHENPLSRPYSGEIVHENAPSPRYSGERAGVRGAQRLAGADAVFAVATLGPAEQRCDRLPPLRGGEAPEDDAVLDTSELASVLTDIADDVAVAWGRP
ncbi:MAG: dockerin type I domain-containing protein [Planctomycetota bacterium]|nr:dockerin type I domain-containing protein [Planctomycetota bacterium]